MLVAQLLVHPLPVGQHLAGPALDRGAVKPRLEFVLGMVLEVGPTQQPSGAGLFEKLPDRALAGTARDGGLLLGEVLLVKEPQDFLHLAHRQPLVRHRLRPPQTHPLRLEGS